MEVIFLTLVLDVDKKDRTSSEQSMVMKLYPKGFSRIHFEAYFWFCTKFKLKTKPKPFQLDPVPISSRDKFGCQPTLHPPQRFSKRSYYYSHQPSHFLSKNIGMNSLQSPSVPLILRNYCWEIEIIMFSSSNPDVVSISWQLFLSNISQGSETLVPREGFPFLKSINSNCQSCK